jgi:hypothetical protein
VVGWLGEQLPELTLQQLRTLLCHLRRWDVEGVQALSFAALCRAVGAVRLVVTPQSGTARTQHGGGARGEDHADDADDDDDDDDEERVRAAVAALASDPPRERGWRKATAAAAAAAAAAEEQLMECWELLDAEDGGGATSAHASLFAALRALYALLGRKQEQAEQCERLLRCCEVPAGGGCQSFLVGALEGGRSQAARVRRGLAPAEPAEAAAASEAELAGCRSTHEPARALDHCDRALAWFAAAADSKQVGLSSLRL